MDLVSIVVPAFNAEEFLRETLESALSQSYPHCEIIVVDDGSTDGTNAILTDFEKRIQIVRQKNRGSASARNAGVAAAKGKWIAFLDSDDVWHRDKIVKQLESCGGFPISHTDSICFGDALEHEIVRSSFEPPHSGQVLEHLLVINFITNSTVMVRREVFLEHGGFDESFVTCEDWALWLKICASNQLGYFNEPVVRYRFHRKSKSTMSRRTLAARLRIIEEAFALGGVGSGLQHVKSEALASAFQVSGHFAAESGDWKFAIRCAASSLRYRPFDQRVWKNLVKSALMPLGVQY
ncbi:MAG TPA: glycosyltransferase [Nitrospira sp.]|nr:glycosyltransferase [Nitrospira sp.]HNA27243.1 glycosyltransferase [Nitrospira sp.]